MNYLTKLKQCALPVLFMYLLTCVFIFAGIISFDKNVFIAFSIGSVFLIIGQVLFLVGAENSLIIMGKRVGSNLFKLKKIWLILLIAFVFVFCTTIAEPDVSLYIQKILSLNSSLSATLLLFVFGIGVGCFTVFAVYRIIKDIPYKYVILVMFSILVILMFFSTNTFIGISLDGAGVTSGPITAPFLLSLTVGISNSKTDDTNENSFGLIAISSIGASVLLMILGLFLNTQTNATLSSVVQNNFWTELFNNALDVIVILVPITIFFLILQKTLIKMSKFALKKVLIGLCITFIGLVLFLTGVTYGFSAMGYFIGCELANYFLINNEYIILLFALLLGFILIYTEPSFKIFAKQVESVTSVNISSKVVLITVGVGVALSVVLSFLVIMFDIPMLFIMLPILVLIIILTFILPQKLNTIAFDSGGLACGTIVPSFVVPLCIGLNYVLGYNNLFGCAGIITFFPILIFQVLGLIYNHKQKHNEIREKRIYNTVNKVMFKRLIKTGKPKNAKVSAKVFKKEKMNEN